MNNSHSRKEELISFLHDPTVLAKFGEDVGFRNDHVRRIGVKFSSFGNWVSSEFLNLSDPRPGERRRRQLTLTDLWKTSLFVRFMQVVRSPKIVGEIIRKLDVNAGDDFWTNRVCDNPSVILACITHVSEGPDGIFYENWETKKSKGISEIMLNENELIAEHGDPWTHKLDVTRLFRANEFDLAANLASQYFEDAESRHGQRVIDFVNSVRGSGNVR